MLRAQLRTQLLLAAIACSCLLLASLAPSAAQQRVEAKGVAAIAAGGVGKARDDAIADAMRKAVESAVGSAVSASTTVENYALLSDKIYTRSAGYVRTYTIVDEEQKDNLYWVTIDAEVADEALMSDLESLGLLMAQKGLPRVAVLIGEQVVGFHGWDVYWTDIATSENSMIELLRAKGFNVVDTAAIKRAVERQVAEAAYGGDVGASQRLAGAIGPQFGADLLIVGRAIAKDAGPILNSQMRSIQANLTVRAVRPDTGEILGVADAHAAKPHVDSGTGGAAAIKEATQDAGGKLVADITRKWASEVAGTTAVQLTIVGLDYQKFNEYLKYLTDNHRLVKAARQRGFERTHGVADIEITGPLSDLLDELVSSRFAGKQVRILERTENTARLAFD